MPGPSNRSIVIISALITLFVLGGATLAVAFRNGWVTVASAEAAPIANAGQADQSEVAVYRGKLDEAYRALDEAYAQVRTLQAAQSQVVSRGGDDDDDDRERRSRRRESDDN